MPKNKFLKSVERNDYIIIAFVVWAALMVLSAFYDMAVSKAVYSSGSVLGNLVQAFGEIPGILFGLFALFIFWGGLKYQKRGKRNWAFIFELVASAALFSYILKLIFDYFKIPFSFVSFEGLAVILAFILISLMGLYLFKTKFKKFSEKNYVFSKLTLLLFVICGAIVELLKIFWGRVRYSDFLGGVGNFSSWYIPQGLTGNSSFPSGHALLGFLFISIFLLFATKNKTGRWIAGTFGVLYGLFISYARVLYGAHYASDVIFSGGLVIFVFLILYKKHFSKKEISPSAKTKKPKRKRR